MAKRTNIQDYQKIKNTADVEQVVKDKREDKRANKQKAKQRNRRYTKRLLSQFRHGWENDE